MEGTTGLILNFFWLYADLPITAAVRFKTCTGVARSDTGIVGSNPKQGMDVCVRLFCVCVVLYTGSGLTPG
jgi:hypothetical protein